MGTAKTTIELNGKLYDARSGKIIGDAAATPRPAAKTAARRSNGAVVDGFVRRPQVSAAKPVAAKPKPNTSRTVAAHKPAAKLEKAKTLMRPAVKKPKAAIKADVVSHKTASFKKEDPHRQVRAAATPKSSAIRRFNPIAHKVVKKEAHLPVATPTIIDKTTEVIEAQARHSVDIIEEGLRNASSHLETFDHKLNRKKLLDRVGFRHRTANIATLSFAGLLLIGFFAFQNAPNIEMRIAAARSGVSAELPGYKPAGFSASRGIKSEPGKVAVTFTSNTDDRNFTVTQQVSNWSSDSLLSNHVLASKQPFQTYQDEGKTVFIYDNSNATWVNGGIWYRVDGDASLTSDQLLRIANSF